MTRKTMCTLIAAMLASAAFGAAAHGPGGGDKFKMMDTNNDGQISAAEHAAGVTKMFGEMDANKDGFVTAAEMDAKHAAKADKGEMRGHDMKSADMISKMDTDGDGKLSAAEHDAGAAAMFKKADADGNGMLSQSEMMSTHDKMMSKDKEWKDKDKGASGMTDHSGHDAGSGTTTPPPDGKDG